MVLGLIGIFKPPRKDQYQFAAGKMRHSFKSLVSRDKFVPKIVCAILIILVLLLPLFTQSVVLLSSLTLTGIWALAAMGFTLVLRSGQFSLGQSAFMALGGYASAILTSRFDLAFWPSFLISGLVSGFVAFLIGLVVLRVGGIYFSIITLSIGEVVRILALQWEPVTRGSRGIITSSPPSIVIFDYELVNFDAGPVPYFYLMICLVAVTGLVFRRIGVSRLGRTFAGIALNPVLAEHQGMHIMKYRVVAFTVAGIFTGYSGALYAHFLGVITPLVFGLWQSIIIMIMSIIGGIGGLVAGPVLGSILIYNLGEYLARLNTPGLQSLLFGVVMVVVIMSLPPGAGLIDLWKIFWNRIFAQNEPEQDAVHPIN
jgi:branched-chain amino acid transport system permease protein